jgi:DNA-binding response OmpR family regulator
MSQPLIAIIEDEEHLAQGLIFNLEAEGYRTHHEADGESAFEWLMDATGPLEGAPPAAILLDVMLPGRDGFSILRGLRAQERYTPVLLLTARGRNEDILEGFAAGADDYLAKPFDLGILFARLSSLLRRMHWQSTPPGPVHAPATDASVPEEAAPAGGAEGPYSLAGRTINLDALEIRAPGKTVHLTLMEADLLRYLLERPGKIIARKELLENVWRVHEDTDTRAIDNFIVRLRRYLEPDPTNPVHLITVRGIGYRFVPNP